MLGNRSKTTIMSSILDNHCIHNDEVKLNSRLANIEYIYDMWVTTGK